MKNLSLTLLDMDSPTKILDIFERDYLNTHKDNIYVEELFMLLYFFKTQVREWHDESARDLLSKDYRVNALISMIMDRYTVNTDFAYQMSTVISLTTLNSFYDLQLPDSWKDKLIECLVEAQLHKKEDGGAFITEVPSLIFALQGLTTQRNIEDVRSLVEGLSMVYV